MNNGIGAKNRTVSLAEARRVLLKNRSVKKGYIQATIATTFAEKLTTMRKKANISLNELAGRSGVSRSVIVRIEKGRFSGLSIDTLVFLVEACGRRVEISFPELDQNYKPVVML